MADYPLECADCSAHFNLDPAGDIAGAACSECGGSRFFRGQVPPVHSEGTLRDMVDSDSQKDQGGNPLGEGTIMGNDGEKPFGQRDNFMHGSVSSEKFAAGAQANYVISDANNRVPRCPKCNSGSTRVNVQGDPSKEDAIDTAFCPSCGNAFKIASSATERVEPMRPPTLNMEPYPTLWSDEHVLGKNSGFLAPLIPEGITLGEGLLAGGAGAAAGDLAKGALQGGAKKLLGTGAADLMGGVLGTGGQQAGGMGPEQIAPAPNIMQFGSVSDVPFILTADMETPHSVKSIGEGHDNPEDVDTHEFNDGESDPNPDNPNLEDSGADGEDAARSDSSEQTGFSEHSPGLERMEMILPLLLHYFQSEESGQDDPIIKGLHEALEQENPGYLNKKHPDGGQAIQMLLDASKQPPKHANVKQSIVVRCPGCGSNVDPRRGKCPNDGTDLSALVNGSPQDFTHPDPWMDNEPGTLTMPEHWAGVNGVCPACEGTGFDNTSPQNAYGERSTCPQCMGSGSSHYKGLDSLRNKEMSERGYATGYTAGVNALPSGLPATPQPGTDLPANNPAQTSGGRCPLCGGALAADGSCPQCGFKQHPQGGPSQVPGGGVGMGGPSVPGLTQPFTGKVANGVGPQDDQQKAAVAELLVQQGREHEIPSLMTQPEKFWKEMAEVQGNQGPTVPLVDPSQQAPPPQPMPGGAPGGMPVVDPSQPGGGGGQPMQPMASVTSDANNRVPRCPKCNSGSTRVNIQGNPTNEDAVDTGFCPSCGNTFKIAKRVILTELVNPLLEDAAQLHAQRPEQGHDPSLTWQDASGQPIEIGQTYSLTSPQYPVPDEVQVVSKKPDELGLKLVGEFANIQSPDGQPDFKIKPQDMQQNQYSFEPAQPSTDSPEQPKGGMPGMDQIPQQPQTTDQAASSYPNGGATVSSIVMSGEDDPIEADICHKCGGDWIDHIASSPTRTMHECTRCGSAWETRDEFEGHEASNTDLSWLYNESSQNDDFFAGMERAQKSAGSRNLADIASGDERYQAIKDRLSDNRMQREAGRHFTPGEQRGLVNERGTARNAELLDLEGTHYESAYDPSGKANGMNAPDEHLVFGL